MTVQISNNPEHMLAANLLGAEVDICFLSVEDVINIHNQIFARSRPGHRSIENRTTKLVRDMDLLKSAIHRPMLAACYNPEMSVAQAASLLAQAIIQNHPFIDGNKRTGLFAMIGMLKANDLNFTAQAADIVYAIRGLASGNISEEVFTAWVQAHACVDCAQENALASKPKF